MNKVIEMSKMLGEALKESEEFKAYKKAQEECKLDETLNAKINEFKVQKTVYDNESQKTGEDYDQDLISIVKARLDSLYEEIYSYEVMKNFTKAEDDFNILMNAVNMTITSYINDSVSSSQTSGCTHDCSSCSGCH